MTRVLLALCILVLEYKNKEKPHLGESIKLEGLSQPLSKAVSKPQILKGGADNQCFLPPTGSTCQFEPIQHAKSVKKISSKAIKANSVGQTRATDTQLPDMDRQPTSGLVCQGLYIIPRNHMFPLLLKYPHSSCPL